VPAVQRALLETQERRQRQAELRDLKAVLSDLKAAEAELRESEERFRTLADNMSQFAWMTDPNGWIFWYNHRWFEYTGITLEEMQGWGWQQVHHPNHIDRVVEHFRHCIETGETWEDTFPLRGKDGNYRWFLSRAIPIKDEAGSIVHWFGTNTDITDRKQIEAELRQKNAILDVVNESVPTPIFVKDRQGRIIYANPATLEALGKSAAEVIGYQDGDLYSSLEDAARVVENDRRIMETGQTEVVEESADGIRIFLVTKAPYRNEAGEVIGLVGISNDISDRKRIEAEREQLLQQEQAAREAAEQANRIKDEFLAVVSHELRTPLNPILGWSKLLQSGKLSPEKAAIALGTIERNAQQQAQLIDDLLDISRILQNKLTLAIAPVDLAVTVTDALETVRLTAEAKSIQLRSSLAANVGAIMGDASRLQQIVWNLLSNAIKFTPENGQVEVRLEKCHGTGNREQGIGNGAGTSNLSPSTSNLSPLMLKSPLPTLEKEFCLNLFPTCLKHFGRKMPPPPANLVGWGLACRSCSNLPHSTAAPSRLPAMAREKGQHSPCGFRSHSANPLIPLLPRRVKLSI